MLRQKSGRVCLLGVVLHTPHTHIRAAVFLTILCPEDAVCVCVLDYCAFAICLIGLLQDICRALGR